MKKNRLVLISLFSAFLCVGFKWPSHKGPQDFDRETINFFKNSYEGGVITAFLGDPTLHGTIKQSSYWLSKDQIFKGKYLVSNRYEEDKEFIFFCLFDYQQVEIGFNKEKKIKHRLFLKKGGEITVPIIFDDLPKGAHDIIFVLVEVSKIKKTLSINDIHTHRANIFVESTIFPNINPASISSKKTALKNSIFKLNKSHTANGKKDINIQLNNNSDGNLKIVSILFRNFSQLDDGKYFFNIDKKQEVSIPFRIKEKKGMMFCLKINNPYTTLEPEPNVLSTINTSIDISNQIFF
jgi:hypothetical protein